MKASPALVLFLLSPMIGELLSGSSPPSEFFTMPGFALMLFLYGGGAVVARELKTRWRKGIGSLLLLGAAYGVIEEGLMVVSFYNPSWPDLGIMGTYGRWLGINWVWAVALTLYHSIVSITVPAILVELAFPDRKEAPWLTTKWLALVALAFISDVTIGYVLFATFLKFWAPVSHVMLSIFLALVLVLAAHRLPADWLRRGARPLKRPVFFALLTFVGASLSGIIYWVLPHTGVPPLITVFLNLAAVMGTIQYLRRFSWRQASQTHRYSLVGGVLALFILFSLFQEMDRARTDDPSGMSLVGLASIVGLLVLRRRLRSGKTSG